VEYFSFNPKGKIVYDYSKLRGKIRECGYTMEQFAAAIGISPSSLTRKIANTTDFTQSQVVRACSVLKIPYEDLEHYFFALQATKECSA
jgi:transcriptional regulator with XRE-family HTH domain